MKQISKQTKHIFYILLIFLCNNNDFLLCANEFQAKYYRYIKENPTNLEPVFPALHKSINNKKIQERLKDNQNAQILLDELRNYYIVDTIFDAKNVFSFNKFVIDPMDLMLNTEVFDDAVWKNKDRTLSTINLQNQWYLRACNIPNAWEISKGTGIIVAVLDTGLDYYNKDFDGLI